MDVPLLSRRAAIGAGAAGGAALLGLGGPAGAVGRRRPREPLLRDGDFSLGVASGAPGTDEIVLWTHVDGVSGDARCHLEVARDRDFRDVVLRRTVRVPEIRDHTVHTRVKGRPLRPGEEYFYRFETRRTSSPVGRFRTARPADSREPVRIGFFSCQDRQAGYYPAHAALADRDDLDLVVCLGDYVYEQTSYEGPEDRKDTTGANGDAFVVSLEEWRDKYKLYRTDPDLRAMHAAHPFVAIWDDHEVEDNYAGDERDPAKTDFPDVDLLQRRRNGYLAFFEHMPRLRSGPVDTRIYGRVPLGRTADLFLLDQRQYRDRQPCTGEFVVPCLETETVGRTFLGAEQKAWFKRSVSDSRARWKIVANQLMIMSVDSVPGVTVNVDAWDGYGAERREILEHFRREGVRDLTFLTGDIHTFFAGTVHTGGRRGTHPIGTEFVGGSITSRGLEEYFPDPLTRSTVQTALLATSSHIRYANFEERGFGVVELRDDGLEVDFMAVDPLDRDAKARRLASFVVQAGSTEVVRAH